jgi:hypothetical protein
MTEKTTPLEARLFTVGGPLIKVRDVPVPPPAQGGRVTFTVTYPAGEQPRAVRRVVIFNLETGIVMGADIDPVIVRPGDDLSVSLGLESAGGDLSGLGAMFGSTGYEDSRIEPGYDFAARVTLSFDGGNHPLKGDLWKCNRCAAVVYPAEYQKHDRDHAVSDEIRANIAGLNEIIAEMAVKVSDDPGFAAMTRELLRDHSHALGFEFQGERGGTPL